jgi:hypothetical protein
VEREAIETRVDELRAAHPGRKEFVEAVQQFSQTLGDEERELLGQVLLERKPDTAGFDVLERRMHEGGWFRRTMRKIETREGRPPR